MVFIIIDCRSSRDTQAQSQKPANNKATPVSPLLPPPPSSKRPVFHGSGMIDFLSGDAYRADDSHFNKEPTPFAAPFNSSPNQTSSMTSSSSFSGLPVFDDEPFPSSTSESLSPPPRDTQSSRVLQSPGPPPPSNDQKQNIFNDQDAVHSNNRSSFANDSLVGQTHNLSLNSSTPTKKENSEDALFKDLMDFAKSKTSSPSKSNPNRPFWEIVFVFLIVVRLMSYIHQVLLKLTDTIISWFFQDPSTMRTVRMCI